MPLSETVRDGLRDLDSVAELSSQQLNGLLAVNMEKLHRFLVSHENNFPEQLVEFHDIPRGPDLVRSFITSSYGLRFFFDAKGIYELHDMKTLRRGNAADEYRGVSDSITIVRKPDFSNFGLELFSTFLAGLREFLEAERTTPRISVPVGHYVFRYVSYSRDTGLDNPHQDATRVYIEESLEVALEKFCHSITIGHALSVSHVSVAVPGRDNWFLLNKGAEFTRFEANALSLPEEIRRA